MQTTFGFVLSHLATPDPLPHDRRLGKIMLDPQC